MLSGEQIEQHRAAQVVVREAAKRELGDWFAAVDLSDARGFRDALALFLEYLAGKYGDAAAGLAADFYDEARASADVAGRYRATLAAAATTDQVERTAGWAVGPLFGAEPDEAAVLLRVSVAAGRWLKTAAADTVFDAAERDPAFPRVVRVPRGSDTCAFCIMLASRGALDGGYASERTARYVSSRSRSRFRAGELREFHDDCDCEAVTIFPGDPAPPGWDADAYAAMYEAGADAAGSRGDTSAILAAMRERFGLH